MTRSVRTLLPVGAVILIGTLAGCVSDTAVQPALDPGGCPRAVRQAISLSAAVVQIKLPRGVRIPTGAVPMIAGTGRRVLIALHVNGPVPRMRLLSDSLDLLTFGGTLGGWARIVDPPSADGSESIEVQGGWLHIAPFVPGRRLHARSEAVDLLVIAGGGPRADVAVRPGPLWNERGRPVAARSLRIKLIADMHMTRLHTVEATARFRFVARHLDAAHERWRCSIATRFPLVGRQAALPDLWVLKSKHPRGTALALYSARTGAFQALFLDPQTARAFARWMNDVRATRAGVFRLGLLNGSGGRFAPLGPRASRHLRVAQWSPE